MRRLHLLASGVLLLAMGALPTPEAAAQGAGAFARFGMGARAVVLGPQAADVFGDASPYHNPALAPFQAGQGLEVSGALLAFDREWAAVQVGAPLKPRSGVAAGVIRGAVGGIDGRDGSGYATGEFDTSEIGFFVAFGTRFTESLSGGLGLRIYRNSLFDGVRPTTALGVGGGLAFRPTDRLALGVVVEDLFAAYNWNASPVGGGTVTDRFPVRFRGGAAYRLGGAAAASGEGAAAARGLGAVLLTAEVEAQVLTAETRLPGGISTGGGFPTEGTIETDIQLGDVMARVGAEVQVVEPLALRVGVDRLFLGDAGEIRPAAGFSLRPTLGELDVRIDYAAALEPFGTGVAQTATLRFNL